MLRWWFRYVAPLIPLYLSEVPGTKRLLAEYFHSWRNSTGVVLHVAHV